MKGTTTMNNSININNCPNLFNLLTLNNVIAGDTFIEDAETGDTINLNRLINDAVNELKATGCWGE